MRKCDFKKVTCCLNFWNAFRTIFFKNTSGELLMKLIQHKTQYQVLACIYMGLMKVSIKMYLKLRHKLS